MISMTLSSQRDVNLQHCTLMFSQLPREAAILALCVFQEGLIVVIDTQFHAIFTDKKFIITSAITAF